MRSEPPGLRVVRGGYDSGARLLDPTWCAGPVAIMNRTDVAWDACWKGGTYTADFGYPCTLREVLEAKHGMRGPMDGIFTDGSCDP